MIVEELKDPFRITVVGLITSKLENDFEAQ
jgi:hypothetical protein